jgi:hypothetical protein
MTPNINIFAGAPNNSPGNTAAGAYLRQRNALAPAALNPYQPSQQQGQNIQPGVPAAWLASAIGHAAVLSDTPEKWASTIALLKQRGIDPKGYETFDKGRTLAIAASGVSRAPGDANQPSSDDQ